MGGIPFRSVLEPYLDEIRDMRLRRDRWIDIAEVIRKKGTPCTPQGIHSYFKRKKRESLGFPKKINKAKTKPVKPDSTTPLTEFLQKAEQLQPPPVRGKILDLE